MIWIIAAVLVALWLGGFLLNVAGNLIHFLLVIAVVLVLGNVLKLFGGRSATRG